MIATLLGLTHMGHRPRLHPLLQRSTAASMRGWSSWPFSPAPSTAGQPPALVQRIYQLASQGDLDGAQAAMDDLTAESVGFARPEAQPARPLGPSGALPHVSYVHIFANPSFSIGIFVLPAGARIPLHDHPDMTVLSKLLYGSLRVTSYDT